MWLSRAALLALLLLTACGTSDPTAGEQATPGRQTPATTSTPTERPDATPTAVPPPPTPQGSLEVGDRVPGMDLWAMVPGNELEADRINLIFAPWGWDEFENFLAFVSGTLSWDGSAFLYDADGRVTTEQVAAIDAGMGLFAIEPWRSSRDNFNVWYTDLEPATPVEWLNTPERPFEIPDATVVTVALDAYRFNPELTSVAGLDAAIVGPGPPQRPNGVPAFANSVIVIDSIFPVGGLPDLAHELGHALFNLPDEYVGQVFGFDGRTDLSSWPSCAEDTDEAELWWGDLKGRVDPMVTIWATEMERAGFALGAEDEFAAAVEVGTVDGGCYGVPGSVRATHDSLMNSSIPVMGSVNRRWAEDVLELWDGSPRS